MQILLVAEFYGVANLERHPEELEAVSALWWAGYVFFDECFLPKAKTHHRVLLAFLLGLVILAATHQLVTQLM
ncbi:MAG: hypothetical protein WCK86_14720 [Planctomycetia bacterium]